MADHADGAPRGSRGDGVHQHVRPWLPVLGVLPFQRDAFINPCPEQPTYEELGVPELDPARYFVPDPVPAFGPVGGDDDIPF